MKRLLLNDRFILFLIILNTILIFLSGFDFSYLTKVVFSVIDNIITLLFIFEMGIKLKVYKVDYFKSAWNKLDFALVALSIPALITFLTDVTGTGLSILLVFRVFRVFKTIRFIRFIPGVERLIEGIMRALKSSVVALFGFLIYVFIIGIFSHFLFRIDSPEYFGDPLKSLYASFKVFTVEGWFEIPESITNDMNRLESFFTYLYFMFVLLTGGIIGLSLVNSIFVDAMVSDNNDELEKKIDRLEKHILELKEKSEKK